MVGGGSRQSPRRGFPVRFHCHDKVEDIARLKLPDLNAANLEAAVQTVKGTARSMGIEVV